MKSNQSTEQRMKEFSEPFIEIFGQPTEITQHMYRWDFGEFYFYLDMYDYLHFQKFWTRYHETMYLEMELSDVLTEIDPAIAEKIIFHLERFR